MEGQGYYTQHSRAQQVFGQLGLDWLTEASAAVESPSDGTPFVIADFGTAGGGSSLAADAASVALPQWGRAGSGHPHRYTQGPTSGDDGTSGAEGLMDAANDALRALVDAGTVRHDEYRAMTVPTWNRTVGEFDEPLAAADFSDQLQLLRHELRWLPDPYFQTYSRGGNLEEYVDAVANFFRAAFEQSLWSSVGTDRTTREWQNIATVFAWESAAGSPRTPSVPPAVGASLYSTSRRSDQLLLRADGRACIRLSKPGRIARSQRCREIRTFCDCSTSN